MSIEEIKSKVGKTAAQLVEDNMMIGLGTGSTAKHFIEALSLRCQNGLKIQAVATSNDSYKLAQKGGIPMADINRITHLDLTFDGADEVDPKKRMIKGAGGALLREKIIASMSREMIVLIDETKLVKNLGKAPLPVEIVPFATAATEHHIQKLGYSGCWRKNPDGNFYITDNGHYLYDIRFTKSLEDPEKLHLLLKTIPGVVETGFFFHLAGRLIVGQLDGQVIIAQ